MKAIKKNFLKFTSKFGFGNAKNNDQSDQIMIPEYRQEVIDEQVQDPIELEQGEFNSRIRSFKDFLNESIVPGYNSITQPQQPQLNLPNDLLHSIFLCIISNSHMLIDVSHIGHHHIAGNHDTGYILSRAIPLMSGLSCAHIQCTPSTTSEELVQQLFLSLPDKLMLQQHSTSNSNIGNLLNSLNSNNKRAISQTTGIPQSLEQSHTSSTNASSISRSLSSTSFQSTPPNAKRYSKPYDMQIPPSKAQPPPQQQIPQNMATSIKSNSSAITKDNYKMVDILIIDDIDIAPLQTRHTLLQMMTIRRVAFKGMSFHMPEKFNIISTITTPINTVNDDDMGFKNSRDDSEELQPLSPLILDNFLLNYRLLEILFIPPLNIQCDPLLQTIESKCILTPTRIQQLRDHFISKIYIAHDIDQYIRSIVVNLRNHPLVTHGPSPRATPTLTLASKSLAILSGKKYVTPSHISTISKQVLNHRILLYNPFQLLTVDEKQQRILNRRLKKQQQRQPSPQPFPLSPQMSSSTKNRSQLSKATLLPPPPLSITKESNVKFDDEDISNIISPQMNQPAIDDEIDSFIVINIILENILPPI
ncbi:hypothetical protein DLAC_00495 [Tieghemostelium lacteum]|uniref:magnesium chelatase n=1 Tax=Tieghemostelium lacteum TaxID=361077 RepID=A0A152A9W1_TIELA|nr:hypothetical protein DLAC_00495 [Tieghemostelium lacteum]|eukprot:KYR03008.1 hypothetical protein DLAC_00495 [Tieghemostelium lacteum]